MMRRCSSPDITYSFYSVYCRLFGIAYEALPLDQAMQIRVADYRRPAGRALAGLCDRRRRPDRGAHPGEGQLQLLSSWPARQAGAIASLEDEAYFQQSRARVIEGRERLNRGLVRLGFEVLPSSANFVFARHPAHEGAALAAALRRRAVQPAW